MQGNEKILKFIWTVTSCHGPDRQERDKEPDHIRKQEKPCFETQFGDNISEELAARQLFRAVVDHMKRSNGRILEVQLSCLAVLKRDKIRAVQ